MRIWIINHYAAPVSRAGNTRHHHLARELQDIGHQVLLVGASRHHLAFKGPAPSPYSALERVDGVDYLWVRTLFRGEKKVPRLVNWLVFAILARLQARRRAPFLPDVVIGSSPTPLAAWTGLSLARRLGVPFVYEVRDLWPLTLQELGNYGPNHPAMRALIWLNGYLYRRAALVVALMSKASHYYRQLGFDADRTICIPNGVSVEAPCGNGRSRFDGEGLQVVYAGNHGLANGLDTILECAEILNGRGHQKGFSFQLVGAGPEKSRLQERAAQMLLDNVFFHPPVPKSRIFDRLQQADVLVAVLEDLSVYQFGMSLNKVYDYLAAGKPVIFGGEVPDNPVEAADAGMVVPPADPEQLAEALLRMAAMPTTEREALGRRGYDYVMRCCSYRQRAFRLEQALLELQRTRPENG